MTTSTTACLSETAMKFHSVSNSVDPRKAALSAEIEAQTAAFELAHGKVQTTPLRALSHDGRTVVSGKVQLTIVDKRKWSV